MECSVLQYLLAKDKLMTMTDIATSMNVSHSRITHLIDALIEKGYITRLSSPTDRRVYMAQITKTGVEIVGNFEENTIKRYDKIIKKLSKPEQDKLFESLNKWKQCLQKVSKEMK
jgi:MarR family 2-MHQ and catechol resistance regulon transcriptional repressor